jgi:hypothetical protein
MFYPFGRTKQKKIRMDLNMKNGWLSSLSFSFKKVLSYHAIGVLWTLVAMGHPPKRPTRCPPSRPAAAASSDAAAMCGRPRIGRISLSMRFCPCSTSWIQWSSWWAARGGCASPGAAPCAMSPSSGAASTRASEKVTAARLTKTRRKRPSGGGRGGAKPSAAKTLIPRRAVRFL